MKISLIISAFLWIANPVMSRPIVPAQCESYAKSFYSVVDQVKRFNGMALTYPGIEADRNRLRFYKQMDKKLVPLISCLQDNESETLEYYQEIKDMTDTQINRQLNFIESN